MSDELKEQAWSELCAMIGQSPSYSAKAFRAAFDFAWNRRADLAAPAEPAGQHDADSNAPWLSLAHSICADAGIAPGNITDRLNQLRERIEPAGQKWESLGIAGDAKRIVAANIKDELVVSVLFDLIDRLATPVMQEPAARVVTIAQGKNTGKQVQMLRDLPSGAELYAAPVPAIPPGYAPTSIDIRQQAINRTCIDGHLNSALDAVMRSSSPDGTFCILGVLATAAIDIALELAAAPSPVPQDCIILGGKRMGRTYLAELEANARRYCHLKANALIDWKSEDGLALVIPEPATGRNWKADTDAAIDAQIAAQEREKKG